MPLLERSRPIPLPLPHPLQGPLAQRRPATAASGLLPALGAPHAEALDPAQPAETPDADAKAHEGAPGADAPEAEVGLLEEVLEVHAVEGCDEGAAAEAEGGDAELEVEQHQGVAVGVEDGFYDFFGVADVGDEGAGALHDLVADFVVGFEQHFDFRVVIFVAVDVFGLVAEVHGGEIVVGFEEVVDGVTDKAGFLLKGAELFAVDEEVPQFVSVDVFFEVAQYSNDRVADAFEFAFQAGGHGDQDGFKGAEFVREGAGVGSEGGPGGFGGVRAEFTFEVVHEEGLGVGVGGTVGIKDENAVKLYEDAEMEEVDKDGRGADGNAGQEGGVDFTEIACLQTILRYGCLAECLCMPC